MLVRNPIRTAALLLFTSSMPQKRRQIFVLLLLGCLMLAASAPIHVTANVQAIQSVHLRLRILKAIPKPHAVRIKPAWGEEKRAHKNPSGPNPVGNHFPPTKP